MTTPTEHDAWENALRELSSPRTNRLAAEARKLAREVAEKEHRVRQAIADGQGGKKLQHDRKQRELAAEAEITKQREIGQRNALAKLERQKNARRFLRSDWQNRLMTYSDLLPPYVGPSEWGRVDPSSLLFLAKVFPPPPPGPNVSNFSDWVFSMTGNRKFASLEAGKAVERNLVGKRDRREEARQVGEFVSTSRMPLGGARWRLVFEDDLSPLASTFTVSSLTINGKPLVAKPDLVFEDTKTGSIVIVDRKATNWKVPTQTWHNVRAQLWAYSKIDDWLNRRIRVCADVWRYDRYFIPTHRITVCWEAKDPKLCLFMPELFAIYSR